MSSMNSRKVLEMLKFIFFILFHLRQGKSCPEIERNKPVTEQWKITYSFDSDLEIDWKYPQIYIKAQLKVLENIKWKQWHLKKFVDKEIKNICFDLLLLLFFGYVWQQQSLYCESKA